MSPAKLIPYDPAVKPVDTEKALKTMKAKLVPDASTPIYVAVSGDCPRCGHQIEDKHWLVTVAGTRDLNDEALGRLAEAVRDDIDLSSGDEEFEVHCSCGQDHKGHPEDDVSCGSRFMMRVMWS